MALVITANQMPTKKIYFLRKYFQVANKDLLIKIIVSNQIDNHAMTVLKL